MRTGWEPSAAARSINQKPLPGQWAKTALRIIAFGEGIVGMTEFFDVKNFSMRPVLVFAVILLFFGCYVTQIHCLCNHHRVDRALRLMFRNNAYGFLAGALIAAGGNFVPLLAKYMGKEIGTHD